MQQDKIKKTEPENKYRRVLGAKTLTGNRVRNFPGDELGTIDEIMIDIPTGRVAYAVLSYGGVLGIGDADAVGLGQGLARSEVDLVVTEREFEPDGPAAIAHGHRIEREAADIVGAFRRKTRADRIR